MNAAFIRSIALQILNFVETYFSFDNFIEKNQTKH